MGKKQPCHTKLCAFRSLISGPQNLILRSRNQIQIFQWKNTSFSNTTLLQREQFFIMFYTINSSPLLVTIGQFLCQSNYQQCPVPLRKDMFQIKLSDSVMQGSIDIQSLARCANTIQVSSDKTGHTMIKSPGLILRQQRRLPPCPLVIDLVPLKCSMVEIYNFFIGCPLPRRKCLGAHALSEIKHKGLKAYCL